RERGLDLFLVQPDASPPVARIMDYGRYKFDQDKRAREAKKKHHIVDVKEIKMRYKIEDHDYQVKLRNAFKFLNEGDKIKVLRKQGGKRHINEWKTADVKRNLRGWAQVAPEFKRRVLEMFPYAQYLR